MKIMKVLMALLIVIVLATLITASPNKIEITSPSSGSIINGKATITGKVNTDLSVPVRVSLSNIDTPICSPTSTSSTTTSSDGSFSTTLDTSSLPKGNYVITVYSSDFVTVVDVIVYNQPLPECSDSIDNDKDGLVDLADSGCSSSSDNNEYTDKEEAHQERIRAPVLKQIVSDTANNQLRHRSFTSPSKLERINKQISSYIKDLGLPVDPNKQYISRIDAYTYETDKKVMNGFLIFYLSDDLVNSLGNKQGGSSVASNFFVIQVNGEIEVALEATGGGVT